MLIRKLQSEYEATQQTTQEHLLMLQQVVADGLPLDDEAEATLHVRLEQLRSTYREIYHLTASVTGPTAPAESDGRIKSLIALYEEKCGEKVQDSLLRFVSVRSVEERYQVPLMPLQERAQQILASFASGNVIDENEAVVAAAQLFLEALDMANLDSEEGDTILDQLLTYFSPIIPRGLSLGKYGMADATTLDRNESEPIIVIQPDIEQNPTDDTQLPIEEDIPPTDEPADSPPISQPIIIDGGDVIFEDKDIDDDVLSDSDEFIMLASLHQIRPKQKGAKTFLSDIGPLHRFARFLLPLFTWTGCLTIEQIQGFTDLHKPKPSMEKTDEITGLLNRLCGKHIVAAYDISGDGRFVYCLTRYADACLRLESVKRSMYNTSKYSILAEHELPADLLSVRLEQNDELLLVFTGMEDKVIETAWKTLCWDSDEEIYTYNIPEPPEPETRATEEAPVIEEQEDKTANENDDEQDLSPIAEIAEETAPIMHICEEAGLLDKKDAEPEAVDTAENVSLCENNLATQAHLPVDPVEIAKLLFEDHIPKDSDIVALVFALLKRGEYEKDVDKEYVYDDLAKAFCLAWAAALDDRFPLCQELYQQLQAATGFQPEQLDLRGESLSLTFPNNTPDASVQPLMLAAYLRAMFAPMNSYDYILRTSAQSLFNYYDETFTEYQAIKPLFHLLVKLQENGLPGGFTSSLLLSLSDKSVQEARLGSLRARANELIDAPQMLTPMNGLTKLANDCFGLGSDLRECMVILANDKTDQMKHVHAVLDVFMSDESIDSNKVNAYIDSEWANAREKYSKIALRYVGRGKVSRAFLQRLTIMQEWLSLKQSILNDGSGAARKQKELVKSELQNVFGAVSDGYVPCEGRCLLERLAFDLLDRLEGKAPSFPYAGLLHGGFVSLEKDGSPWFDAQLCAVKYAEPWRSMLRLIAAPVLAFSVVKKAILDPEADNLDVLDNLRQLECIDGYKAGLLGQPAMQVTPKDLRDNRQQVAETETTDFLRYLSMAYFNDQINEDTEEYIEALLDNYKDTFFEVGDYGCWRQFLSALNRQIADSSAARFSQLKSQLNTHKNSGAASSWLDQAERLINEQKYSVAEDYITRFEAGQGEDSAMLSVGNDMDSSFRRFLSDSVFEPIYRECTLRKAVPAQQFAWNYTEPRLPREWTSRTRESSLRFLQSWPFTGSKAEADTVHVFLNNLGFESEVARKRDVGLYELFEVPVRQAKRDARDYLHPIAAFGTQMVSPMEVLCLKGNYRPKELVDTICARGMKNMAIVLLDGILNKADRATVSEVFHKEKRGQSPFIIIDRVLLLYLAQIEDTRRLPELLQCSLPYTSYQPFIRGSGHTPDEMFSGRVKELQSIMDSNGASVVYGGRQLGKTALLLRAEHRCHDASNHRYAIFIDCYTVRGETAFVERVTDEIQRKTGLPLSPTDNISGLCREIDRHMRSKKIETLLLLLDETDGFLTSISHPENGEPYHALHPMIDLKRQSANRFRFVLAGLHNVYRAKNATERDGVFGQLGNPLCIKPLSPSEAFDLLAKPLAYLGFQVDSGQMEAVLANTNYYPGLLQLFGYNLVEKLTTEYASFYNAANHPPYPLGEVHLSQIMSSLFTEIRDKFLLTLNLDQRYYMLARCVALLYHLQNENIADGFTIDQILEVAHCFNIQCLQGMDANSCRTLLDEMTDMGVFSAPVRGSQYRLRRQSLLRLIGKDEQALEDDILKANEEVQA